MGDYSRSPFELETENEYTKADEATQPEDLNEPLGQDQDQQEEDDESHWFIEGIDCRTQPVRIFFTTLACFISLLILTIILITIYNPPISNEQTFIIPNSCINEPQKGKRGMVSTTNNLASEVGWSILSKGGNAFDAAIAIQLALAVVQPQSTGLGGGLFCVGYHSIKNSVFSLDGREEAGESFTPTAFCRPDPLYNNCSNGAFDFNDLVTGGHPVGVPGVISALQRLYFDYGSGSIRTGEVNGQGSGAHMSWSDLFLPAIELASNGFPMYDSMRARLLLNRDRMILFNSTASLFFPKPGNWPLDNGEIFKNPDLANTLNILLKGSNLNSQSGPADVFYSTISGIPNDIVNAAKEAVNPITRLSGLLTVDDIKGYKAVYRKPVRTTYRNEYAFYSMDMPSSGGTTLALALSLLQNFDINQFQHNQAEYLHRLLDVQDIAFSDRNAYMADSDFLNDQQLDLLSGLLNKTYGRSRLNDLSSGVHSARSSFNNVNGGIIPPGVPPTVKNYKNTKASVQSPLSPKRGTTHFVVSDPYGNVVSLTTTIEENFGSGVVVPGRGFLLNNELTDFTNVPWDKNGNVYLNRPEGGKKMRRTALNVGTAGENDSSSLGGKRPLSSMSPSIVMKLNVDNNVINEEIYLALGSPGGSDIIGTVLNVLISIVDSGLCIGDAVASPRAITKNANRAQLELPLLNQTIYQQSIQTLVQRGFQIEPLITKRPLGYVQVLKKNKILDLWEGVADSTRLPEATAIGLN